MSDEFDQRGSTERHLGSPDAPLVLGDCRASLQEPFMTKERVRALRSMRKQTRFSTAIEKTFLALFST